jgi:hypothetical protein
MQSQRQIPTQNLMKMNQALRESLLHPNKNSKIMIKDLNSFINGLRSTALIIARPRPARIKIK